MTEQERRQQIMQAAERLFTNRRFHEITTDEIAAAAEVGKGTIYRYFKNKEDLFYETALNGFEQLCVMLNAAKTARGTLQERLLRVCQCIDDFFCKRRRLFCLMQAEENRLALKRGKLFRDWRERRQRLTSILSDIIAEASGQKKIRTDIDPDRLAVLLLGMLKSIAHDPNRGDDRHSALVAEIVELFLYGAITPAKANLQT